MQNHLSRNDGDENRQMTIRNCSPFKVRKLTNALLYIKQEQNIKINCPFRLFIYLNRIQRDSGDVAGQYSHKILKYHIQNAIVIRFPTSIFTEAILLYYK